MKLIDYKQTSFKFRRLSSNLLTTQYEDAKVNLVRLKNFIDNDPIIKKIISDNLKNIDFEYKSNNFIYSKNGYWLQINKPIDEDKHMKAIYDYMNDIVSNNGDLVGIASRFRHNSNKLTDIVRNYIEIVFKPLIDYIIGVLSEEMMYLESKDNKSTGFVVNQNIGNNYGVNNFSQKDITSNNIANIGLNESEDIKTLISKISSNMRDINMDDDAKEDVIDELNVIEEQLEQESPKVRRLQKACRNIVSFISKIPTNIEKSTVVVSGLSELLEKVNNLIQKLCNK